jgi:RIO-like serine/threonine protein kinase
MATRIELKRGALGDIGLDELDDAPVAVRELRQAQWLWLARRLARREARALALLAGADGFPALLAHEKDRLVRRFLPGEVMYVAAPRSRDYFREALRRVRIMHSLRIAHNDLAKEANWICRPDGLPGIVDFQLSICFTNRSRLFRLLAREDLRHLLKHKRYYRPDILTARELAILEKPMWPARFWKALVKPCYRFVTRRVLGWPDREGAAERQRPA